MNQASTEVTLICPQCSHEWKTTATQGGGAVSVAGRPGVLMVYDVEDCAECWKNDVRSKGEIKSKLADEQMFRVVPKG
jgi:hypothetical protein